MSRYEDKKAVITGGTIGMGLAIAKALVAGGAEVLLTGRNERNLAAARAELGDAAVHVVRSDAADLGDIKALPALVEERLGVVDAVFINAGVARLAPFEAVTVDDYDHMFDINAKGAYFTAQGLVPLVRAGGAFVFTTVTDGTGTPTMSVYLGSKAAQRSFANTLAAELVTRDIRVSSVAPGFIKTPTMGTAEASPAELAAFEEEGSKVTPMRRLGTAEEVARAALFLAFDATFTTGAELPVDGGISRIDPPHD